MNVTRRDYLIPLLTLAALLLYHPMALRAEEAPIIDPESVDDVTLALFRLVIETPADEIPDRAYEAAKAAMMDALGCAFGGQRMPGVPPIVDLTKEWGGRPDPVAYARFLIDVANALHAADPDGCVLNAGFDPYTPNTGSAPFIDGLYYMDEETFLDQMHAAYPDVFAHLDGFERFSHAHDPSSVSERTISDRRFDPRDPPGSSRDKGQRHSTSKNFSGEAPQMGHLSGTWVSAT